MNTVLIESTLKLARDYYAIPGNICGGNLHIVLDDGNLETQYVNWCRSEADKKNDTLGVNLCDAIIALGDIERHAFYCDLHGSLHSRNGWRASAGDDNWREIRDAKDEAREQRE